MGGFEAFRRAEVLQDLHAMRNAKSHSALRGTAEAMKGLGRWSPTAEVVYAERLIELGEYR